MLLGEAEGTGGCEVNEGYNWNLNFGEILAGCRLKIEGIFGG